MRLFELIGKQLSAPGFVKDAEITMWTNPAYRGADVDDKYYKKQPVKVLDVSKLTPFEPADKMKPKDNYDNMMKFVGKIKAGKKIKPIVVLPHKGKLLIVDGHHRYFAHLTAGADKIHAVIADPKDVTWRDDVPDELAEAFDEAYMLRLMRKAFDEESGSEKQKRLIAKLNAYRIKHGMDAVKENFADGKNPERKGLSKRVGVSQKMSIAQLEKIAKNSTGEKRRMAQWNLNMKRGRLNKNK